MADITQKIKSTLSYAFRDVARHQEVLDSSGLFSIVAHINSGNGRTVEIDDGEFHQPPVDFEKKTGMRGLSGQYILPPGVSSRELQDYVSVSSADNHTEHERLSEVWGYLKRHNPETLGRLKLDEKDTDKLGVVIVGAASAFLAEDIQSFIDGKDGAAVQNNPENKKEKFLRNKLEMLHGSMQWIPCLSTLQAMDLQSRTAKRISPEERMRESGISVGESVESTPRRAAGKKPVPQAWDPFAP